MIKSCTTLDPEAFESTLTAVEADASAGRGTFRPVRSTRFTDDADAFAATDRGEMT